MSQYTDEEILSFLQDRNTRDMGFNLLVRQYQERLYHQIRRMVISHEDTDDVLQTVFIKTWKNIDRFRGEAKIYTWLYRIAMNESITFLNRKKRKMWVPFTQVEKKLEHSLETSEDFQGEEIQKKLLKAMMTLPEKQRAVFNLKYFEELKYEDIAEITGTSVGALKASYHHAVKKIEDFFHHH